MWPSLLVLLVVFDWCSTVDFYSLLFTDNFAKENARDQQEWVGKMQVYYDCMNERKTKLISRPQLVPTSLVLLRESAAILNCFECLSPNDQEELEDEWKPDENVFLQHFHRLYRIIKRPRMKKAFSIDERRFLIQRWHYNWQFMPMSSNASWQNLFDINRNTNAKSYLNDLAIKHLKFHNSELPKHVYEIGDHYELIVKNLSRNDTGWYRCYNQQLTTIANVFHIDVLPNITTLLRIPDSDTFNFDNETNLISELDFGVIVKHVWTEWSPCNRCNEFSFAERRRRGICTVTMNKKTKQTQDDVQLTRLFQIFDSLPCHSSLLPPTLMQVAHHIADIEDFESCSIDCPTHDWKPRYIKAKDESGVEHEVDVLLPNEYSINDRLPILPRTIMRDTLKLDELVISCPLPLIGRYWKHNDVMLHSALLFEQYNGRVYIDYDSSIIFRQLSIENSGFYSCHAADINSTVLKTVDVTVTSVVRKQEIVGTIGLIVGFVMIIIVAIKIASNITSTNVYSESRNTRWSIKLKEATTIKKKKAGSNSFINFFKSVDNDTL